MRALYAVLILCFGLPAYGQFGVTGFYNVNRVTSSEFDVGDFSEYPDAAEVAIHYWFRLKRKRVEFQPTLYYVSAVEDFPLSESFGFQFKTNIYPFDFGTDCECPTFGKQGPQLQKGLFLQLSPGIARHRQELPGQPEESYFVPTIGAGIGLDFGVSNLLTLTPIVSLRHTLGSVADVTFTSEQGDVIGELDPRLTTYQFGLQATFRLDKRRY